MFAIGLTGGIGSGKSTISDMLRAKGAATVYADQIGHEVYRPGTPAWDQVVAAFGRQVVGDDGQIDRRKLGQIVFSDPEARRRLDAITHPPMEQMMSERLEELRRQGTRVVVLEAAILIEAGFITSPTDRDNCLIDLSNRFEFYRTIAEALGEII